jgi:pilus assembly protein FimV
MNHHGLGRWRIGALASAIALLGSMASPEAQALALGRITVQSALGESLRAEIDITDLNAEETSSLRVGIAAAEAFKAAGLEYSSAAASLDVKLQRRADGRSFLRLSSNRAMTEPFVDLILEAKWSSGRVTRDYTMLFDPPKLRANSAALPPATAPLLSRAPDPSAALPPTDIPRARYALPIPPAARPAAADKTPAIRTSPSEQRPAGARQVTVNAGDNASRIAAQNRPASVSLDQMLVALLKTNPDAFIGGNINVIKSGAVLTIPDAQTVNALGPVEATQTLVAQSRDFNTFRRKLAESVPATQVGSAERQVGGKLQASVEDRAQINTPPDKLTLSKGAVQGQSASASEDKPVTKGSSRAAELSNNASDLGQTGAAPLPAAVAAGPGPASVTAPAGVASSETSTAAPALVQATTIATGQGAGAAASVANGVQAPLAPASVPGVAASAAAARAPSVIKPAVVTAPAPVDSGLIGQIKGNSVLLLGAGGLLAVLAGLGFARYRKTKKAGQVDSSFLDSRLQPDSFFGASGGGRIDTSESAAAERSSIAYSPSQLDASGDVDPVAEADVYLAYGRDQQAEEILREALRIYPARLSIHSKLLEIYAKRRDSKAFESVALAAFKLSKGHGAEWSYISEMGRNLDSANSLYRPGAGTSGSETENRVSASTPASAIAPLDLPALAPTGAKAVDNDLDLEGTDFTLDEAPGASMPPATPASPAPSVSAQVAFPSAGLKATSAALNLQDLDLDLNLDNLTEYAPTEPAPLSASASTAAKASALAIDFLSEKLDFSLEPFTTPLTPFAAPPTPPAPAAPVDQSGMLAFDLSSLSLDLDAAIPAPASALIEPEKDPLEVKFLLAEEFRILGDADGARALADEVMAKAKGPLKVKAQAFLNALS